MAKSRRYRRQNTNDNAIKKTYGGPYQNNPNMRFEQVRKHMETPVEGPTAETFSYSDSTTHQYCPENSTNPKNNRRPKSRRKKVENWWSEHWRGAIVTCICSGIGIIIFNYSNHFVAVDKDIESIKEDISDNEQTIKDVNNKTIELDKKVDLLDQKIEYNVPQISFPNSQNSNPTK